jgi:ketosteroid isomerase-like protein
MTLTGPSRGARPAAHRPDLLHELFAASTSAGDLQGLLSLFEPGALIVLQPGDCALGERELRAACARLCARYERLTLASTSVHVADDLALTRTTWRGCPPGGGLSGPRSTEILRRQPDGRWLAVIADHCSIQ